MAWRGFEVEAVPLDQREWRHLSWQSPHHIGCTWHGRDGLRDTHDLELRYSYNSERLALQGQPRPEGSWAYTEPNGRVHTISAERARAFMESTHRSATLMVDMLSKLRDAGVLNDAVQTEAQPA